MFIQRTIVKRQVCCFPAINFVSLIVSVSIVEQFRRHHRIHKFYNLPWGCK